MVYGTFCKIIPASWVFRLLLVIFLCFALDIENEILLTICVCFFPCFLFFCHSNNHRQQGAETTASCFIKLNKDTINIILLFPQQLTGTYHFTCMVFLCVFLFLCLVKENCIHMELRSTFIHLCVIIFYHFLYNSTNIIFYIILCL